MISRPIFYTLFLVSSIFLVIGWSMSERGLIGIAVGIFLTLTISRLDRSEV